MPLLMPHKCKDLSHREKAKLIDDWQGFLKRMGEPKPREKNRLFDAFAEGWALGCLSNDTPDAGSIDELGDWYVDWLPWGFGETRTYCISHSHDQGIGADSYEMYTIFHAGAGHPRYPNGIQRSYIVSDKGEAKQVHDHIMSTVTAECPDPQAKAL